MFKKRLIIGLMMALLGNISTPGNADLLINGKYISNASEITKSSLAQWRIKPDFSKLALYQSCTYPSIINIVAEMDIDKYGNVSQVTILKSSGNRTTDAQFSHKLRGAKFYPFRNMKTGLPKIGRVILPIIMECSHITERQPEPIGTGHS